APAPPPIAAIVVTRLPAARPWPRRMSLAGRPCFCRRVFFYKQKTAYEIGLGIPAEPLFRSLMVTVCPSQFATRRTLFHVLVGCGLLMLKVSRLKLPVIWLLVSMWLNTLTKSQIWTLLLKV